MTKGGTIPAASRFPLSRAGREGVGSRFRGNDVVDGDQGGRGALRPIVALSRRLDSRLRGNDGRGAAACRRGAAGRSTTDSRRGGMSARYYAGGALADCLRVSVGTSSGADKLLAALKSALG